MNILVVGGAGHVGSILRPALEREHCCYYFDLKPIPGAESRSFVGNVRSDALVDRAIAGCDAIVYLALGIKPGSVANATDIDPAFSVNVGGWCRFLQSGLRAGVRRFVYASSMSVYQFCSHRVVDEDSPANAWHSYGLSKRFGEELCRMAAGRHPDAVIIALRMYRPMTDEEWQRMRDTPVCYQNFVQGPDDLRRLYLAALACNVPGAHILNTTGDVDAKRFPNTSATELLGWSAKDNLQFPKAVRNMNKTFAAVKRRLFWKRLSQ